MMEYKNAIEQLLDEENCETVYLKDNKTGRVNAFEQMALIPYDKNLYAILVTKEDFDSDNLENGGLVYRIDEKNQNLYLVEDDNVIFEVFDIYDRMYLEGEV